MKLFALAMMAAACTVAANAQSPYGNLDNQDNRDAIFELLVLSLMMPDFHTQPCPNTTTKNCQHK